MLKMSGSYYTFIIIIINLHYYYKNNFDPHYRLPFFLLLFLFLFAYGPRPRNNFLTLVQTQRKIIVGSNHLTVSFIVLIVSLNENTKNKELDKCIALLPTSTNVLVKYVAKSKRRLQHVFCD
jgi:hypothetical protein